MLRRITSFLLLLTLILFNHCLEETKQYEARDGVLDLREWDFTSKKSVNLEKEWEFYPENIEQIEDTNNITKLFYSFGKPSLEDKFYSYGSFKLKLLLPENISANNLFLRISGVNSAYTLSIKEKLVSSKGNVGKSKVDSIPQMSSEIIPVHFDSNEVELILKISDFHSGKIGFNPNIELGSLHELETKANLDYLLNLSFSLPFLFIFFYSLTQIKEKIFIVLAISSICILYLIGVTNPYPLFSFFSATMGKTLFDLKIIAQILIFLFSNYLFYSAMPSHLKKWIKISITILISFFLLSLLASYNLPLHLIFEKLANGLLLFLYLFLTYRFFHYGPSSFARIKTYTQKYKTDLDKTLKELQDNKKAFDQKLIERSFNMVTYMEKLEIQTGEMEKLNELIIHLLEGANIDEVLDEIFSHIMTYYRANIAFLYFIDPDTNEFFPYRGITKDIPEEIKDFMSNARMPVSREAGPSYIAYKRKKTIYFENAKTKYTRKKEKNPEKRIPELLSSLYIPVLIRNEFQGIFFLATFNHPLNLNKDKIKFISMFTNQLTAAIQKEKILKAMEEEKRRAEREREKAELAKQEAEAAKEEIEAINSLAKSINENLELKFIMEKIMNFVEMHYGIKFYSLHILNDNKQKMYPLIF